MGHGNGVFDIDSEIAIIIIHHAISHCLFIMSILIMKLSLDLVF